MLKSFNALFISTSNMQVMIDFYQNLGLPLEVSDHGDGLHAEANLGEMHFALQPWKSHSTPTSNVSFSFLVPNLEEHCRSLLCKGFAFITPPQPQSFGGVTATLRDPDGNLIFLTRWQTKEEYATNFPQNSSD